MSTPVITAVPTPVPAAEVNVNMPKEQIAAAVPTPMPAAPVIPVVTAPTPENPVVTTDLGNGQFEVKYLTGETFKGTAAEILPKMGGAHVSTKLWAKDEIAKAKLPAAPPAPPSPKVFATPEEEATANYVTELQAKALGFSNVDEYKQALGRIQQNTEQFAGQNLSLQFAAAAPEFNATPENSEKLLNTVETLGLTSLMVSGDSQQQLNALRAAHAFALQTKIYDARPSAAPLPVTPIPPPPIPSTGPVDLSTVPEELRVDQNMPKEEIVRRIELAKSRNYIF